MICSDTDICNGCIFDDGEYSSECRIKNKEKDKICPCVECLLKGMCMETCPGYEKLLDEVDKQ